MYKLLIVDDEFIIADGLRQLINWEKYGFEVIGIAEDGVNALEYCNITAPDVVITDIVMPYMSGLELNKQLHKYYPGIYVITLSGYSEFAYAQAAINNGAYKYLLKPLDKKELIEILKDLYEKLSIRDMEQNHLQKLQADSESAIQYEKKMLFTSLLKGPLNNISKEVYDRQPFLLSSNAFRLLLFNIEEPASFTPEKFRRHKNLQNKLHSILNEVSNNYSKMLEINSFEQWDEIICLWSSDEITLNSDVDSFIHSIRSNFKEKNLTVCISALHRGASNISEAYIEATYAFTRIYYQGRNSNLYYDRISPESDKLQNSLDKCQIVFSEYNPSSRLSVNQTISTLRSMLDKGFLEPSLMTIFTSNIIAKCCNYLFEAGIDVNDVLPNLQNDIHNCINCVSGPEKLEKLHQILLSSVDVFENKRFGNNSQLIDEVKNYIKNNYANPGLRLGQLAEISHLSDNHLCKVFKKETGETIVDYITDVRMEKACNLVMTTNMKIYEIAEKVGFNNTTYFVTLFKKYYELTPSEMRKND